MSYGEPAEFPGQTVKIYCEANPEYYLTATENDDVVLSPANELDPHQQWFMDEKWGLRIKDEAGFPAFALVNRASGQALKHGSEENEKVTLGPYSTDELNVAILWTQSADVGSGYKCIRPVDNTDLNLDAEHGDTESGGIRDGNGLILFRWKKHDNQKWKIFPISQEGIFEVTGHHVPQPQAESVSEVIAHHHHKPQVHFLDHVPEGRVVKIYCEQSPNFFVTVQNDEVILASGDENDVTQHWIVVTKWGNIIKDEAGFPAFALVSKATLKALKHGTKEWDRVGLGYYNDNDLDESVLWSQSADVGHGYQCIRPVTDIHLNLDAKYADGKHGNVEDGNELILFSWKKQKNQKWKMLPVDYIPAAV